MTKTAILLALFMFSVVGIKAQVLGIPIDQPAPEFIQNDIEGKSVSLESFKGKYVLLDFWASWCGPCRMENPNLVAAYKKYHEKGFEIISVSLDEDKEAWEKANKKDNPTWAKLSNLKGYENEVAKLYNVTAVPYNYQINPDGLMIGSLLERTVDWKRLLKNWLPKRISENC